MNIENSAMHIVNLTSFAAFSTFGMVNDAGQMKMAQPLWMMMSLSASEYASGEMLYILSVSGRVARIIAFHIVDIR